MRIVASLFALFFATLFQCSYAFDVNELIKTERVHEMQLSISEGAVSGLIYFDKIEHSGYCSIKYIELDEASVKEHIIPMRFLALSPCNRAAKNDFSVELKNIRKINEKTAVFILKEIASCTVEKCFQKSKESTLLISLLPVYPSEVSFIQKNFVVKVVMANWDKDYHFYFSSDGKNLTHVSAVDSYGPD